MRKILLLSFCLFLVITSNTPAQTIKNSNPRSGSPAKINKVRKDACQLFASVLWITLGRYEVLAGETKIDVVTTARAKETTKYLYTVTAGKIVGEGQNVMWDLSGVSPGTYMITAAVDDGRGVFGQTQTRKIVVKECADCETKQQENTLTNN
jgi:hypothetical protein